LYYILILLHYHQTYNLKNQCRTYSTSVSIPRRSIHRQHLASLLCSKKATSTSPPILWYSAPPSLFQVMAASPKKNASTSQLLFYKCRQGKLNTTKKYCEILAPIRESKSAPYRLCELPYASQEGSRKMVVGQCKSFTAIMTLSPRMPDSARSCDENPQPHSSLHVAET